MTSQQLIARNPRTKVGRIAVLAVASIWLAGGLAGCATVNLPEIGSSAQNQEKLHALAGQSQPVKMGEFRASGAALRTDQGQSVRSNTLAPKDGSFALQLRNQLQAEFRSAGLLDATGAALVISGVVTENELDAPIGTGKGKLTARIQVLKANVAVFDKEITASATWDSPFVGATAIPAAFNQYGALFQQLAGKLIDDPAFRAAIKR